jgi:hypothetical protein
MAEENTKTVKAQFIGTERNTEYNGWDPLTKDNVRVKKGDVVEISKELADRLEKDFPNQWSINKDVKTAEKEPVKNPEDKKAEEKPARTKGKGK